MNWSKQCNIFLFLDSNHSADVYGRYECLLAAGAEEVIQGDDNDLLSHVQQWHDRNKDWLLGHICYDYKNNLEKKLSSPRDKKTGWPLLFFFCPRVICYIDKAQNLLTIASLREAPDEIYREIISCDDTITPNKNSITFSQRTGKESYLHTIANLRQHIRDGDCYEINFCCEGYAEAADVEPLHVFESLNRLSASPFASFYRNADKYMMCASIERYLRKESDKLVSQPIKGTARRGKNAEQDNEIKEALKSSVKDRAENVMIVDLVRNDLARCCETGSVHVDELCGIYTFPQVHQMISAVSGRLKKNTPFTDAIRYSFPMGSMTGAPKIKVMELISRYEDARRELFSGTVGYIDPVGDFDFNVIIRSIFYNDTTGYLSYQAGGAITYDSDAMQEWDEMRLKAWALERIFTREYENT